MGDTLDDRVSSEVGTFFVGTTSEMNKSKWYLNLGLYVAEIVPLCYFVDEAKKGRFEPLLAPLAIDLAVRVVRGVVESYLTFRAKETAAHIAGLDGRIKEGYLRHFAFPGIVGTARECYQNYKSSRGR